MRRHLALAAVLLLSACAAEPPAATAPGGPLPSGTAFDYQLGGSYPPPSGAGIVVRDSRTQAEPGAYSICYVNAFQTQPAAREDILDNSPTLVLHDENGPLVDPNWPDELIYDLSTEDNRAKIADLVTSDLDRCRTAGYHAAEFDNLDSYLRSRGRLTADMNFTFATEITARAHTRGLAVAQKNSAELTRRGRDEAKFDFAIAEECHRHSECAAYTEVYGDAVLAVEYTDDLRGSFAEVCRDPATPKRTILRDRQLVAAGKAGHVYERCEPRR